MTTNEITILIIEDEQFSRTLLVNMLENMNYRVLEAADGVTGREIAVNENPDLILLDVVMPGENGFETCEKLKKSPVTSEIPVIFVSGKEDVESKVKGLTIGGWDYITKPYQEPEVEARVRNCLKLGFAYKQVIKEQAMRLQQMREAQQSILVSPDEIPEANFAVSYLPVLEAGGDFYDVFSIAKGICGYLVADISGHDISASFATSALKALVRQNSSILHTPDETVRIINQILTSLFKEGQHLTAVYTTLNRTHNVLAVVNAGHLPILFMPQQGEPYWIEPNSDILGAFNNAILKSEVIRVGAGDRIFIFSDGLIESFEEPVRTRSQGMNEFLRVAQQSRQLSVTKSTAELTRYFISPKHLEDDVVLLGVDV